MIFSRRGLLGGVAACGTGFDHGKAPEETLAVIAGVDLSATSEIFGRAVYFVEPMAFAWSVINPFGILDGQPMPDGVLVRYVEPHGWVGFDPASYPDCDFVIERIDVDEETAAVHNRAIALIATSPPCYHEPSVNRLIERLTKAAQRHAIAHGFQPVHVIASVSAISERGGHARSDSSISIDVDGINHGDDIWKMNSFVGQYLSRN